MRHTVILMTRDRSDIYLKLRAIYRCTDMLKAIELDTRSVKKILIIIWMNFGINMASILLLNEVGTGTMVKLLRNKILTVILGRSIGNHSRTRLFIIPRPRMMVVGRFTILTEMKVLQCSAQVIGDLLPSLAPSTAWPVSEPAKARNKLALMHPLFFVPGHRQASAPATRRQITDWSL